MIFHSLTFSDPEGSVENRWLSRKFCRNERNNGAVYLTASSHFHTRKGFRFYARSGRTSVSHY